MGLSIKNEEVEARVRRLAEITGLGVTEAVDDAVRRRLEALEHDQEAERVRVHDTIEAIRAKYGPLPPLDQKAIDEEMYDENGLPR